MILTANHIFTCLMWLSRKTFLSSFSSRAHCVTRSVCLRWCFWGTPRWERARSSITTAAATSPITWPQLWVRDARHFMLLLNLIPVVCWQSCDDWLTGMDFQVRSVMLDSTPVALQLWDTAGQERSDVPKTVS